MRKLTLLLILVFSFGAMRAQVLVHQEPYHLPVFKNGQIRVLSVQIPPGDTSLFHLHHTPSLFIFLSNTNTGTELQGKAPTHTRLRAGRLLYENLAAPYTRIHRVWNTDTNTLHVIDVELLGNDSGFSRPPLILAGLALEVDTAWVRAYRLSLDPGKLFDLKEVPSSLLLVSIGQGSFDIKQNGETSRYEINPGWLFNIPPNESFSVRNAGDSSLQFILVELPGS